MQISSSCEKASSCVYLGHYVVNLGVHQSSSVSVLGYAKDLSTNLQGTKVGKKSFFVKICCIYSLLFSLKICFFFFITQTHLRQRGCGYVHVTPCRHRQKWRNAWPAPIALGTVSRCHASPSSRILPPWGFVCQMAERDGGCLVILAWHQSCVRVFDAHFDSVMTNCYTVQPSAKPHPANTRCPNYDF